MKIVQELIEDLSSSSKKLSDILLRAKVFVHKLNNKELNIWLGKELNGYPTIKEVPEYRIIGARLIGDVSNGYQFARNATIPIGHLPKDIQERITTIHVVQSISTLEEFLSSSEKNLTSTLPPELYAFFSDGLSNSYEILSLRAVSDRGQVAHVITSIKSKLLDFLLAIDSDLKEEDLKSPDVRREVGNMFNQAVFGNYTTVIVGDHNIQTVNNTSIKGNFDELAKQLKKHRVPDEDIAELKSIIDNDNPDHKNQKYGDKVQAWISKMLTKAMSTAWNISLGSAGSLLAECINAYYGWF